MVSTGVAHPRDIVSAEKRGNSQRMVFMRGASNGGL